MKNWFLRGLTAGIRTEPVPESGNVSLALSPGLPKTTEHTSAERARALADVCPTRAISAEGSVARVDDDHCVLCMRCKGRDGQTWRRDVAWAHAPDPTAQGPLEGRFARSLHVRIVDAGDCGSCLNELAQLNGPSYNLHRFGIFIVPTPRQADVLLVVGPAARQMHEALLAAYEAMPEPKRVVAVGVCAASGGIFGPSLIGRRRRGSYPGRSRRSGMPATAARHHRRTAHGVRSNATSGEPVSSLALVLTLWAIAVCIVGAALALIVGERFAPRVLAFTGCTAAALSFVGGAMCLIAGPSADVVLWTLPSIGSITIGTTTIASWFTCIASLVYVPTSLFTVRYIDRYAAHYSLRAFTVWYCALLAAIIGLFICRDVVSFFIDWEVIAIASALLVAFEWRHVRNARAAFIMLGMSEAGTMAALLAMLLARGGSLSFAGPPAILDGGLSWAVFLWHSSVLA